MAKVRNRRASRFAGIALIAFVLGLWQLSATCCVASPNWPPISEVLKAMLAGLKSGELAKVFLSSLGRMFSGLALGAFFGTVLGMAAALNRWVRAAIEPLVELLRPIPVPAIIPPLILMLGVDDAMKIFVVALSTFFPMFISALSGVRSVDAVSVDVARTFQLGRGRRVLKVIFPASLPYLMAGLRTSLALALIVTVVAEMIAGSQGIGFYVMAMQYSIRAGDMYAALVLLALLGFVLNALLGALENRVLHWFKRTGAE